MNFADLPIEYSNKKESLIYIHSVPYDETSTWIKGSDKGPKAIIEASNNLELYDIETDSEVYKKGIYTAPDIITDAEPKKMVDAVYVKTIDALNNNKFIVTIGGEHSISIGAIKAHAEKYSNLSVLQIDAHADLRDSYLNSKYNHACVMARVKEFCPFIQVGIRSMDISEKKYMSSKNTFFAKDIYNNTEWVDNATSLLNDNVYITIDLDAFDPSIMPSTGTPEPGGLFWYDVLQFIKNVNAKKNVVGFDVVELCPNDVDKSPDFLAAKLIYKILSYKYKNK